MADYTELNEDLVERLTTERDNQTISKLSASLAEITANIHMLLEGHKELRERLHFLYEHECKLEAFEQRIKQNQLTLQSVQEQLRVLEQQHLVHRATYEARVDFLTSSMRYGPILITILMTLISIVVAIKELSL